MERKAGADYAVCFEECGELRKHGVYSLFSGAGGMDLGFELTKKFKVLLANDILPTPADSYSENFGHKILNIKEIPKNPKLPLYLVGDIADINFDSFSNGKANEIFGDPL